MLRIRPAVPRDLFALSAFSTRTYVAHFGHLWSATALPGYLESHYGIARLRPDLHGATEASWLLAEIDGDVAGFAKLRRDRPLPLSATEHGVELEKLYIDPARTGMSIGSALLDASATQARQARADRIWLDVLKTNLGARRLYERHGYVVCGEIPFATDEHDIGMWLMQRTPP